MRFFNRIKEIVSSNVNHALDKMEDPQKMIRLMVVKLESTLDEAKASLAVSIASQKRTLAEKALVEESAGRWDGRARMAVEKGLDDLAREALAEKRALSGRLRALEEEAATYGGIIESKRELVGKLEDKLAEIKDKSASMAARALHAKEKIKTEREMREMDGSDMIRKFQEFESKVDRLEAEARLSSSAGDPASAEARFEKMEGESEIEAQLQELKASLSKDGDRRA